MTIHLKWVNLGQNFVALGIEKSIVDFDIWGFLAKSLLLYFFLLLKMFPPLFLFLSAFFDVFNKF